MLSLHRFIGGRAAGSRVALRKICFFADLRVRRLFRVGRQVALLSLWSLLSLLLLLMRLSLRARRAHASDRVAGDLFRWIPVRRNSA